ncbi:MAG: FtsX-like permease family protein [bacterium]
MGLLFKLSWRNIWRNKRRSILTLCAITFATFATVGMRGIQKGVYAVNIKNVVNISAGYIQIQKKGYQENPSINKCFVFDDTLKRAIESNPAIKAYSQRIYSEGLISFKDNSQGAIIFGIDPQKEKNVTGIVQKIKEGEYLSPDGGNEIILGRILLKNLKAKIGDEVVLLVQGYDGSLGNEKFKIVGMTQMGSEELDGMSAFIGLRTAQELLALYGSIHAVAINLDNIEQIPDVIRELKEQITNNELVVLDWGDVLPDFKQSIEFDNVSGIFFLFILILIVAFGILNTVLMSVTERFNEFGVTLSIGMPQIKLVQLVIIESMMITLIGILFGNMIGWGINYYLVQNPIQFGNEFARLYEEFGFLPVIESSLEFSIFLNSSLSILAIAFVASLYPAYKVYKLEPLKGIRYT